MINFNSLRTRKHHFYRDQKPTTQFNALAHPAFIWQPHVRCDIDCVGLHTQCWFGTKWITGHWTSKSITCHWSETMNIYTCRIRLPQTWDLCPRLFFHWQDHGNIKTPWSWNGPVWKFSTASSYKKKKTALLVYPPAALNLLWINSSRKQPSKSE